jgi:spore coat polysaccharide biosynthesis predicted glycosyltransferase SpsG
VPAVALSVAPNQDWLVDRLGALGAHINLKPLGPDFEAELKEALHRLNSQEVRVELKSVSSALCDGRGAERVAEAFLGL